MFTAFFGCHIKAGEANELVLAYQEVTEEKITIKSDVEIFHPVFLMVCNDATLLEIK